MESVENKFGAVQFLIKTENTQKKVFFESIEDKRPRYTSGFPLCATICRAIWACRVAMHHIEQSLRGVENMEFWKVREHQEPRASGEAGMTGFLNLSFAI